MSYVFAQCMLYVFAQCTTGGAAVEPAAATPARSRRKLNWTRLDGVVASNGCPTAGSGSPCPGSAERIVSTSPCVSGCGVCGAMRRPFT